MKKTMYLLALILFSSFVFSSQSIMPTNIILTQRITNLTNITISNITIINYNVTGNITADWVNAKVNYSNIWNWDWHNAYTNLVSYVSADYFNKTESNALFCPISGGCGGGGGSATTPGGNNTLMIANECGEDTCNTFLQVNYYE